MSKTSKKKKRATEDEVKENKLSYLLPIRSIMFLFVFVAGSLITRKGLDEIGVWAI